MSSTQPVGTAGAAVRSIYTEQAGSNRPAHHIELQSPSGTFTVSLDVAVAITSIVFWAADLLRLIRLI